VDFTVTTRGPTFDQLTRDIARDLTAANKKAGRQVARKGKAAAKKGAPHMFGTVLSAAAKTEASATSCKVTFSPKPAGAWTIAETGTKPHTIKPRSRKALHWAGLFAEVVHHPGTGGRMAWTAANGRIAKAVGAEIEAVYGDALAGRG
jgi:hypothetical protein